jgi:hypothetical protein
MKQIFKTSGISIDDTGVTITKHADGSLLFTDSYIPGVKLKDIIGGSVVIEPSVLVQIFPEDWTYDSESNLYEVDVPNSFGLVGTQKAQVLVVTMDLDYSQIIMNSIQVKENSVFITSTDDIDMYVTMKRI